MNEDPSNVSKLERLYDTFEEAGFEEAARVVGEIFDADVEFNALQTGEVGGRTYRGYDGMLGFFGELNSVFKEVHYEPPQFHPVGESIVIVFTRLAGLAVETSMPLRQDLALVYHFNQEGRVRCVDAYETPAEALEAAQRGHCDA
jgi:ketosteroid isomerase-like protein